MSTGTGKKIKKINKKKIESKQTKKETEDIVSLCRFGIKQWERQMYFYSADYPQAHCPAVRDACA